MQESWREQHRKMLEETSRFIEWGLAHPDLVPPIPAKPIQQGGFPRQVSEWFWAVVLSPRNDSWILQWREMLLRRGREMLKR